ncbi:MAG TPA: sigma-70 family RNA polymerase sigma factor [Candidatus Sulfotelmatobacter sp.]|jgi:RNA polymerase sigma-70 factor (ECF subfamily)
MAADLDVNDPNRAAVEPSEDEGIVQAARDGDRIAFGSLYQRYARMVHGVLLAKVPFADVDDLVQDTFVRALRNLSGLRENGRFGPWLAAIARNLANDHHRHAAPMTELDHEIAAFDSGSSPDTELSAAGVLDAIRILPDTYRETLILRLVEGMTGPEIAAHTGLTPGSVRVNLHRGMQQLRASLKLRPQSAHRREGTK